MYKSFLHIVFLAVLLIFVTTGCEKSELLAPLDTSSEVKSAFEKGDESVLTRSGDEEPMGDDGDGGQDGDITDDNDDEDDNITDDNDDEDDTSSDEDILREVPDGTAGASNIGNDFGKTEYRY